MDIINKILSFIRSSGVVNTFTILGAIATIIGTLAALGAFSDDWKKLQFVTVKIFFQEEHGNNETLRTDKDLIVKVITDITNSKPLDKNPIDIQKFYDNQEDSKNKSIKVGVCGSYHSYPPETQTVNIHLVNELLNECKRLFPSR